MTRTASFKPTRGSAESERHEIESDPIEGLQTHEGFG